MSVFLGTNVATLLLEQTRKTLLEKAGNSGVTADTDLIGHVALPLEASSGYTLISQ